MEIFGIRFAPLHVPLQRRLQTISVACWFGCLAFGGLISVILYVYLLLFTNLWWLALIYLIWMYLDKDICEKGGRPIEWVQNCTIWRYSRDYYPAHLTCVPGVKLDPNRNYLFSCFPHGILSPGVFNAFCTKFSEFQQLFPHHSPRVATLHQHYFMPFFREIALSTAGVSASAASINYVLSRPEGGHILVLLPGGAAESYHSRPGKYKILLKRRKGFVRLALQNGTPLVPVVLFGEPDLFDQMEGPNLHRFQEFLRKYIGLAPVILVGRGFFQYSFGIIPQRKPVTTLVGTPIEVTKTENPTKELVEEYHKKFTQELVNLFEEYKHKYVKDPENTYLEV